MVSLQQVAENSAGESLVYLGRNQLLAAADFRNLLSLREPHRKGSTALPLRPPAWYYGQALVEEQPMARARYAASGLAPVAQSEHGCYLCTLPSGLARACQTPYGLLVL